MSHPVRKKTLLVILDGFGINPDERFNAIARANTPNFDNWLNNKPNTTLLASGKAVGLPDGQMGSSEVGHSILGSGVVVAQELVRISAAIEDKSIFDSPILEEIEQQAFNDDGNVHFCGLVSDGGVHSHIDHLRGLVTWAYECGLRSVVHVITDGRDRPVKSGLGFVRELEEFLASHNGVISSVAGRYHTMDRDNRWERVEMGFAALHRLSDRRAPSAEQAISDLYAQDITDEFLTPTVIESGSDTPRLNRESALLFFNFRADRARQICRALGETDFAEFGRGDCATVHLYAMSRYAAKLNAKVLFEPPIKPVSLAQILSESGLRQFHCAETEKYAHVTFFFNGGREEPFDGEDRHVVPSPKVDTYDLAPQMSARAVADKIIEVCGQGDHEFVVVNFANADMVGHTAVAESVIRAVEVLDEEVGRVVAAAEAAGYSVIITSDHGNCDEMVDAETGQPHTQHSLHPVPAIVIDPQITALVPADPNQQRGLDSITPTVMSLLGLPRREEMAQSLVDLPQ